MSIKKFIVTTTIFKPSLAVKKFSSFRDWKLIVVGDLKTPHQNYDNHKNIIYLSPKDQEKLDKKLSVLIGWNCVQRRNFGYLYAYLNNAQFVATIDDDNIPYSYWPNSFKLDKQIKVNKYSTNRDVFDPLSIFKFNKPIWHRGFPLEQLELEQKLKKSSKKLKFDVQANLWNKNPDIDAINRMNMKNINFKFDVKKPYTSNKISPFNSQNTILTRECIKNYFLFPYVGRMDDIWASYYVQSLGFKVFFDKPTVYQERNIHSIYNDFLLENIGYKNNLKLIYALLNNPKKIKDFIPKKSYAAFKRYKEILK